MSNTPRTIYFGAAALLAFAWAMPARAHITMVGDIVSRGGDQKMSPCDGAKGDGTVYTFEPGATINLKLMETIKHPSYFRISFDNDGDDGFVEPASIKPIDPLRACPFDADDQCGASDYCNVVSSSGGATVLWDNLNPHLAADAKDMSWNVKLPDVECDNCTLQVIQVMEDTVHGAYCPQGSCANAKNSLEDIYHRCIDIKLKRGATNSAGTTSDAVNNQGIDCASAGPGAKGTAAGGSGGSGGAAGKPGGSGGSGGSGGKPSGSSGSGGANAGGSGGSGGAKTTGSGGSSSGSAGSSTEPSMSSGSSSSGSSSSGSGSSSDSGCSVAHAGAASRSAFGWASLSALLGAAFVATRLRRRRRFTTA